MSKTLLFITLAMATACAASEKPAASAGDPMNANVSDEARGGLAFAVSNDGTKIAFERVGNGPALVIVGGALSQRDGGKPLAGALRERFTIFLYDRRGRGDSGDTKPYAVEREIDDLDAVIAQAGGKAYLYGVSSGAALALQTAAKLGPSKVTKLAVYDAPYGQDDREFNEQKQRINQLVETGEPGDAAGYFFTAIGTPAPALEEMKRSPEWEAMSKIDFTLAYDYQVLGDGDVPDSAKQIQVPTLVMVGEKSLPFMHPAADRMAESIPNAQRKTIENQAHAAAPDVMAPVLIEFFGDAK